MNTKDLTYATSYILLTDYVGELKSEYLYN